MLPVKKNELLTTYKPTCSQLASDIEETMIKMEVGDCFELPKEQLHYVYRLKNRLVKYRFTTRKINETTYNVFKVNEIN